MSVWYQSQDIRTPDSEMGGHSMTKSEFISRLKDALANELNSQKVQEHVNYYSEYISDEVRKGRSDCEEHYYFRGDQRWNFGRVFL